MKRHQTPIGTNATHSTFLRGGQIFFHNARMFLQLLARLVVICVIVTGSLAVSVAYIRTDPTDIRMFATRSGAQIFSAMGQPDRHLKVRAENDNVVRMTAAEVIANPVIRGHSARFKRAFLSHVAIAAAFGLALFVWLFWWFTAHGKTLGSDRHLRGARVLTAKELKPQLLAHNRAAAKLYKNRKYAPYEIAGLPYAYRSETTHTLLVGTTGSGKSQIMTPLLEEVRRRGDRAIVYDKMRSYIPAYFDEARGDQILNPLDERCSHWTPFADARSFEDFRQMASALIPENKNAADPFWEQSARIVFAATAYKLYKTGNRSLPELLRLLLQAPLKELASFVSDTIASASIAPDNPKTAGSIRATLVTNLASLQAMDRPASDRPDFSIREWVRNEDSEACLFLSSRSDQHETLRPLISTWMDIALNAIMSQDRDPDRTIWLFLDELPSLNQLSTLEKGLAEGRQYGAAYVLGIQSLSQLESTYRKEVAHTITGLCRTKVILNLADPDTAKTAAKYIGRSEVQRAQRGVSFGAAEVRDGNSYTLQDKLDHLVLPEQLMRLPNLEGYLIPAVDLPAAAIKVDYRPVPKKVEGFIAREYDADDIDWSAVDAPNGVAAAPTPAHQTPAATAATAATAAAASTYSGIPGEPFPAGGALNDGGSNEGSDGGFVAPEDSDEWDDTSSEGTRAADHANGESEIDLDADGRSDTDAPSAYQVEINDEPDPDDAYFSVQHEPSHEPATEAEIDFEER